MAPYKYNEITNKILKSAVDVHKSLGPGFVEKIYQRALAVELRSNKLNFEREKELKIIYKNIDLGFEKVDFVVEEKVLVELKAVSEILDLHIAQILSYLKASKIEVGLILNFAKRRLEIKRVVL